MRLLRHHRNYLLLWLANAVSVLGDVLFTVGVMFTIYERTGSAFQTIGVMLATLLPPFLLGPVAGVLVDRYPRKWVMAIMDVARAVVALALLLALQRNVTSVWLMYGVVAALAACKAFFDPARQAAIPSTVPREDLVLANSLIMTTTQAAYALGYGVGGLLVLRVGFAPIAFIDAITFILSALFAAFLHLPRATRPVATKGREMWREAWAGLRYIRSHPLVRPLLTMEFMEYVPHGIWTAALMLAFTERALNGNAVWWGWQNASYYAGMLVGALLASIFSARLAGRLGYAIVSGAAGFGLLTFAYALSPNALFAVFIAFFFGPISMVRDLAQDALLQATVESSFIGRVVATRSMGVSLTFMLAAPLFAWAADHASVRLVYISGAVLYLVTAFYALSRPAIVRSAITKE